MVIKNNQKTKQLILGILFVTYTLSCWSFPTISPTSKKGITAIVGALGLYGAHYWFQRPCNKVPTTDQLNTYTFLPTSDSNYTMDLRTFITNLQNNNALMQEIIPIQEQMSGSHADHQSNKQNIKTYRIIKKGIAPVLASCDRIALYSRGYAYRTNSKGKLGSIPRVGGGIVAAYTHIRDNMIPFPCVTFDKCDHRRSFNFGQDLDIKCLETIYDKVTQTNPDAKITLLGDCLGGLVELKFIANNPEKTKNVDTIILESPITSAQDFIQKTAESFLYGASWLLNGFFNWYLPNYKTEKDTIVNSRHITGKTILIGHLITDKVVSNERIDEMVTALRTHGNEVYLVNLTPQDFNGKPPYHSRLSPNKKFQQAVTALYKQKGMISNEQLTHEESRLLAQAKKALTKNSD